MKLKNITEHPIRIRINIANTDAEPDPTDIVLEPSGIVARVSASSERVDMVNGIPVMAQVFGEMQGLPDAEDGVILVGSMLVAQKAASMGRTDVVGPDTSPRGGQVKTAKGFTFAVIGLQKF